jgi:hypothetical protein
VNQIFSAEYPMIRWLERNGCDVSYLAGVDSDRRGRQIRNHKLVSVLGHDEVLVRQPAEERGSGAERGGQPRFLSGNEIFWKTCYEPNGELQQGQKLDPLKDVWTGTWRDSYFQPGRAEAGEHAYWHDLHRQRV